MQWSCVLVKTMRLVTPDTNPLNASTQRRLENCSASVKKERRKMKDFIRTLFGIRKKRQSLPPTDPPARRVVLVRGCVKMSVSTEISEELWHWLMVEGWRVSTYYNDRRVYTRMPENAEGQLMQAGNAERSMLHKKMLKKKKKDFVRKFENTKHLPQ